MEFTITAPLQVEDASSLEGFASEYYDVVLEKLAAVGGKAERSARDHAAAFRENLDEYLPPNGRLVLAHDAAGTLVGGCTLNKVRPDAAELKRLFVRPSANGHGLGRKIMERQFEEARAMGCQTVLINVVRDNNDMLRLCEKMGFQHIER